MEGQGEGEEGSELWSRELKRNYHEVWSVETRKERRGRGRGREAGSAGN